MARTKQKAKPSSSYNKKFKKNVPPVNGGIRKPREDAVVAAPDKSEKASDLFPDMEAFVIIMVADGDKRFCQTDDPPADPSYALLGYSKAEGELSYTWKYLRRGKVFVEKREVTMCEAFVAVKQAKVKYTRQDGTKITCVDLMLDSVFYIKERGKSNELTGHVIVDCDLLFGSSNCTWLWDVDGR